MGYALAEAAVQAGHQVLLISGPTHLPVPQDPEVFSVKTAAEMYDAVAAHIGDMDAAIFSAAVADYTPAQVQEQKIKKTGDRLFLELIKTKDILGSVRKEMNFQGLLVGFAAETEHLLENARKKLQSKKCNLIVANDVSRSDIGFDTSNNEAWFVTSEHEEFFPRNTKQNLAVALIHKLEKLHAF